MKKIIISILLLSALTVSAQEKKKPVEIKNSPQLYTPKGYSHYVQIDLGNSTMLIISGMIAFDKNGQLVGKDDLARQTEQIFSNIKTIIEEAGGNMNDLVKLTIFMTDVSQVQIFRDVRNKFINNDNPPASTLVEVSKLAGKDLLLEVESTVIIPKR